MGLIEQQIECWGLARVTLEDQLQEVIAEMEVHKEAILEMPDDIPPLLTQEEIDVLERSVNMLRAIEARAHRQQAQYLESLTVV